MEIDNKTTLLGLAMLGAEWQKIQKYNAHIEDNTVRDKFGSLIYTIPHERIVGLFPRLKEVNPELGKTDPDQFDINNICIFLLLNYGTFNKPVESIPEDLQLVSFKTGKQEYHMAGLTSRIY